MDNEQLAKVLEEARQGYYEGVLHVDEAWDMVQTVIDDIRNTEEHD